MLRPLERFIADLFWFSPFAWAIRGELDYWRGGGQKGRDDHRRPVAYARALTRAARHSRRLSAAGGGIHSQKEGTLVRRETLFTDQRPVRKRCRPVALIALAAPLALAQGLHDPQAVVLAARR